MYINDLTNDLSSSAKLLADYNSLFSVAFNVNASVKELNDDLGFNPDISKQALKEIFSKKLKKNSTSSLNVSVKNTASQKHLGIILDESLSFEVHLKITLVETNKTLYL